jgi:4-hydroxybenzoate polyprenyltransferase
MEQTHDIDIPLVVDLDGTLLLTDTLHESILLVLKRQPWLVLLFPLWLLRGRGSLKSEIARRVQLAPDTLPYRKDLLEYLKRQHASGRKLVLATAADHRIAEAIAAHTGLFSDVLASDASVNRKGREKASELVARYGLRQFDYAGNSRADVPVWHCTRVAHVAGHHGGLSSLAQNGGAEVGRAFPTARPGLSTWIRALRTHHWAKNVLIFVPLLLAHQFDVHRILVLILDFLGFSLLASGTYVINDLLDLTDDRRHPVKHRRPFASGELSIVQGLWLAGVMLAAAFGIGIVLGSSGLFCLLAYAGLTVAYSCYLKHQPILDVMVLAFLYTLRLITGGVTANVHLSPWLFQFSIFLFLSLAFVKRYSELHRLRIEAPDGRTRGYRLADMDVIGQAGIASGTLAGLVLALYVNGQEVQLLYPWPYALWGACPIFLYWITHIWLVARRGEMNEDPILYMFRDKVSYIAGFLILVLVAIGTLYRGR